MRINKVKKSASPSTSYKQKTDSDVTAIPKHKYINNFILQLTQIKCNFAS